MQPDIPSGVWPILMTPFKQDGSLDLASVDALVSFYASHQANGLFVLGQASEFLTLNDEERYQLAITVARCAKGKMVWTCAANYGNTLADQAESLRRYSNLGPDAVIISLSILPSHDHLDDQLLRLADLTGGKFPLGIYECPDPEHRLLSADQVRRVAASGCFYIMKDTCREIEPFTAKVNAAVGTPLKVFQANWKILPESMDAGAAGFCGHVPMVAPELTRQMLDSRGTSPERYTKIHQHLLTLQDWMRVEGFPASAKYILQKRGVPVTSRCRVSTPEVFTGANCAAIDARLAKMDWFTLFQD